MSVNVCMCVCTSERQRIHMHVVSSHVKNNILDIILLQYLHTAAVTSEIFLYIIEVYFLSRHF